MSDSDSDPDPVLKTHPLKEDFEQLKSLVKPNENKRTNVITEKIEKMMTSLDDFFTIYYDSTVSETLYNDISAFFDQIQTFIKSFIKHAKSIKSECSEIAYRSQNDLNTFITSFSNLIICSTDILERIKRMVTKNVEKKYLNKVLNQFYLEIAIFKFANDIKTIDRPPYYQISSLPIYKYLHDQVHTTTKKFINVAGPHGSGKTNLIPLLLASRSLGYTIKSQFIIVIENDIPSIQNLKALYKQVNMLKNKYMKDGENCLLITSSLDKFYHKSAMKDDPTIIAILTPLEGIQLIRKMSPNPNETDQQILKQQKQEFITFLKKSTFIIDDINQRKAETDVLSQDILNNIFDCELVNERAKLALLGTYSDSRFLTIFGRHCHSFEVPINAEKLQIKEINCKSVFEIAKIAMIREMKDFLYSWIEKKEVDIGSIIVFVPNVKTGRSFKKNLIKICQLCNKIVLIQTQIKTKETTKNFNERLLNDIDKTLVERSEDPEANLKKPEINNDDTLFILPIDFTGNINDEEKKFVQYALPPPLIKKKLVRVIISTNQNEHLIKIPDATVIFDSGLTETEYYDVNKCVSIFKTEQMTYPNINQRNALIEDKEKNVHFIFTILNNKRHVEVAPFIKRCDLIQSILQLRSIDINFENQRNLPNEPVFENVENRIKILSDLQLIMSKENELTELGKLVSRFSLVSSYLAIATANFKKNQEFAFLISLIIDRSAELIENSKAPLLCDHFCKESDLVTILDTILAMNTNEHNEILSENEVNIENSGISMRTLEFFYIAISNAFNKKNRTKGREAVINSIIWSKQQPGGTMAMIDEYINFLDNGNFLNMRKATFEYIVGVGTKSEPALIYKANDALKFDPSDENAFIKYSQRPGCIGLQSPGNIIALNFQVVESIRLNRGLLMHRDPSATENIKLGVISQEVKSFLNSCFFVALFESYWNDNSITNDLIPIYHSNKPKKETGFLIHINESNKKTYISYCPKVPDLQNKMNESIQFLSSLMPFVPRSVVCKNDIPLCAVEIISYGTSRNYETHVYLIDKPEKPKPNAYQLNKQILEYAVNRVDELRKTSPKIRFSITGESVYYKFNNKRQIEADFSYPNVNLDIKSVFNPSYSSHLVLLVDSDYSDLPGIPSIPWILNDDIIEDDKIEDDDINKMIDLSNKIINDLGSAHRSADLFFITLDNGFPSAKKEEIPDFIQNQIEFDEDDQGAIKQGIHKLIQQITTKSFRSGNLTYQIPLKNLSSTDHCTRYTTEESQTDACEQIKSIISSNIGLKNDNVDVIFVGPSMICISIHNLHPNRTLHPPPDNIWDDSYHPCEIDSQILEILKNNSIPATSVTHEPTIEIMVYHLPRFNIEKEEFEQKVNDIADQFGFLNYIKPSYEEGGHDKETETSVIGEMTIGLFGRNCWTRCATLISKQFPVFPGFDDLEITISMTMTMSAISSMRSLHELNPNLRVLKVGPVDKMLRVPQCEIESIKDLIKNNKEWKLDENYRVLIIKLDEEEEAKRIMQQVRQEKMNTTCFLSCGLDEPELLPQYLYVNEEDGSVKQLGICKKCAKELLESYNDIKYVYNPVKHLIDYDRLKQLKKSINGFDLVAQKENGKDEWWPQIPLGQMAWTLMSDPNDELISYVKAWFTIVIEYAIQKSDHFMFCPDHPQIPIIRPNNDETVKCSVCDMVFCKGCNSWHKMVTDCYDEFISPEVKRCPGCHVPGIRFTGCDHMTCPECKCEWNYQTGAKMNK